MVDHQNEKSQTGCNFFVSSKVIYCSFENEEETELIGDEVANLENKSSEKTSKTLILKLTQSPTIPPRPSAEKIRKLVIPNTNNIFKRRQSHS